MVSSRIASADSRLSSAATGTSVRGRCTTGRSERRAIRRGSEAVVDDAIMGVLRYENHVLMQTVDPFRVAHAGAGLKVPGHRGSIFTSDVMTQDPIGTVRLRGPSGDRELLIPDRHGLYEVGMEQSPRAVEDKTDPAVSGTERVLPLAVALAVAGAAADTRVPVRTNVIVEG